MSPYTKAMRAKTEAEFARSPANVTPKMPEFLEMEQHEPFMQRRSDPLVENWSFLCDAILADAFRK